MIANIYPEARFMEESGSTLRFATSMMKVVNKPNVNVHMDQGLLLKKYFILSCVYVSKLMKIIKTK